MRFVSGITVISCGIAAAASAQSADPLRARLDAAMAAIAAQGFSGVVRVDSGGATALEKGYGIANRAASTPFTPATVVQIGSNTKDFTIVSMLQLQERGRLNMNDSLGKYFPAAPPDKRDITLWQIARHRAGFPIGLGGDFEPVTRAGLIDAAMKRPLNFPPGTARAYSNTGYSLLAAIIEGVTGVTYDEYVRDNILKPLGMGSTGLLLPKFDERIVARGYQRGADYGTMLSKPHAADGPYWNLRGNGGMLSTLDDMHTFYTALFTTNKLLRPDTRQLQFESGGPIGLAGSDNVSSFLYELLPVRRIEVIVASNSSEWPLNRVRDAIAKVLDLPSADGPVSAVAPKTNVRPPKAPTAATLTAFIAAVNSGDAATLRAYISEHFALEPGGPSVEARAERLLTMHTNLGALTIVTLDQTGDEVVEISLKSAIEGPATIKAQIDPSGVKIRGIQVLVGG